MLQKTALAALGWWFLRACTARMVYSITWPGEKRRELMRAGRWAIHSPPPLPIGVHLLIDAVPTVVVGTLVLLYLWGSLGHGTGIGFRSRRSR